MKLAKEFSQRTGTTTTEYAGNYVYEKFRNGASKLQFLNQPEGYIEPKDENDFTKGFNYIYQYKDHLGNIRLSYADENGDGIVNKNEIREEKNNYPFGLTHKGYNSQKRGRTHKYGYNGKEENLELGLATLDFGARNYSPDLGRWMNIDPLADKYVKNTPYAFVANSPVLFVDPDGRDIVIWYKNENNEDKSFRYNGNNGSDAPDNKFVNDVLTSLCYNCTNGGGDAGTNAANDSSIVVEVQETEFSSKSDNRFKGRNIVNWNPSQGIETENGDVLSPSTVLEHEVDHAYDKGKNEKTHSERADKDSDNGRYTNDEEKRVITGSETKTARANGEISGKKRQSRFHHGTNIKSVIVDSPTSTKVNQTKTAEFRKKLEQRQNAWTSE